MSFKDYGVKYVDCKLPIGLTKALCAAKVGILFSAEAFDGLFPDKLTVDAPSNDVFDLRECAE